MAADISSQFIESSIEGPIADTARKLYSGHFSQRPTFRRIYGMGPDMLPDPAGVEDEENIVLPYLALSAGLSARTSVPWRGI